MVSCQGCGKETDSQLCCPKCRQLSRTSFFCSQECFKSSWAAHNRLHDVIRRSQLFLNSDAVSQCSDRVGGGNEGEVASVSAGRTPTTSVMQRKGANLAGIAPDSSPYVSPESDWPSDHSSALYALLEIADSRFRSLVKRIYSFLEPQDDSGSSLPGPSVSRTPRNTRTKHLRTRAIYLLLAIFGLVMFLISRKVLFHSSIPPLSSTGAKLQKRPQPPNSPVEESQGTTISNTEELLEKLRAKNAEISELKALIAKLEQQSQPSQANSESPVHIDASVSGEAAAQPAFVEQGGGTATDQEVGEVREEVQGEEPAGARKVSQDASRNRKGRQHQDTMT